MQAQPSQLVQNIEARFQELGIEKNKIAKRLGVTESYIYQIFSGERPASKRFEPAALSLIEEAMQEQEKLEKRRARLLAPSSQRA